MNKSESKYFNTAKKMDIALISLLKNKPFEYITISEICESAGVNRSTFYLHYETIRDLLDETVRYLLDDFLSYFSSNTSSVRLNIKECSLDELNYISDKYLIPYLTYIKDNKEIFLTALLHSRELGLEDINSRMFENIFCPILNRFHYPANDMNYIMMYYLNGLNAIIIEWLKDDCNKPMKEIIEIINICVYGLGKEQKSNC